MCQWYIGTLILPDFNVPFKNEIIYKTILFGSLEYTMVLNKCFAKKKKSCISLLLLYFSKFFR